MSDDLLRELMRSPLDEQRPMSGRTMLLSIGAGAAVVGAGLVLVAGLLLGSDSDPQPVPVAAASTTSTTRPATTTVAPQAVFTPAGDRLGLRPDWVLERDGRVYVSITAAVTAGTEPASVARMEGGLWSLGTGADRVEFTTEYVDPTITGRITVEFPANGAPAVLSMVPGTSATVEREQRADVGAMPFIGPLPEDRIPLARAVELVIDDIDVRRTSGAIAWHLEGGTTERARVGVAVDLLAGEEPLGSVMTRHSLPFIAFLRETNAPPGPTRNGVAELVVPFGTSIDSDRIDGALLHWTVDVFHYEDTPIAVPLDGVTTVTADAE